MPRRPLRTAISTLALIATSALLAGCFTLEATFTVNDDATADLDYLILIDTEQLEEFSSLLGEDLGDVGDLSGDALLDEFFGGDDPCADLTTELTDYEVATREINEDGEAGVGCTVSGVPIAELNSLGDDTSSFSIEQDEDGTRFNAVLEGVDELTGDPSETEMVTEMLGVSLDDLFTIRFVVTAPGIARRQQRVVDRRLEGHLGRQARCRLRHRWRRHDDRRMDTRRQQWRRLVGLDHPGDHRRDRRDRRRRGGARQALEGSGLGIDRRPDRHADAAPSPGTPPPPPPGMAPPPGPSVPTSSPPPPPPPGSEPPATSATLTPTARRPAATATSVLTVVVGAVDSVRQRRHRPQEIADEVLAFDAVAHRAIGDDLVPIAPALAVPGEAPRGLEVLHDALHGALGDTDLLGEVAQTELRIAGEADQHVAVVRQERPGPVIGRRRRRRGGEAGAASHGARLRTPLPELNFL